MSQITNKFPGRCACGTYVQPTEGYVHERKITCIQCVPLEPPRSSGISWQYQGCDDIESMSEFFYDTYQDESDFVGFDVGAQ